MNPDRWKPETWGPDRSRREFLLAGGAVMAGLSLSDLRPPQPPREESRFQAQIRAIMQRYGSEFGNVRLVS